MKNIDVTRDLVPINIFSQDDRLIVDPVYTFKGHEHKESPLRNQFPSLYQGDAQIMWGHKDIVAITVFASDICQRNFGWRLRVADCLRTVEAQEGMEAYGHHPSLVSLPGTGAHPRGMAIDIIPEEKSTNGEWRVVDMGVPFDHFSDDPENDNPAARNYTLFGGEKRSFDVDQNRRKLEFAMNRASQLLKIPLAPLPDEYWDFRLPSDIVDKYAPLKDQDLLPIQRQISDLDVTQIQACLDNPDNYPDEIAQSISEIQELVQKPNKTFLAKNTLMHLPK